MLCVIGDGGGGCFVKNKNHRMSNIFETNHDYYAIQIGLKQLLRFWKMD